MDMRAGPGGFKTKSQLLRTDVLERLGEEDGEWSVVNISSGQHGGCLVGKFCGDH